MNELKNWVNYLNVKKAQKGLLHIDCEVSMVNESDINHLPKVEVFYRYCHTNELRNCDVINGELIHSERHQMLEFLVIPATQTDIEKLKYLITHSNVDRVTLVNLYGSQPIVSHIEDIVNKEIKNRWKNL